MILTQTEPIGILPCPGAERLTGSLINYLRSTHIKRCQRSIEAICRRHQIKQDELIRQINLAAEFSSQARIGAKNVLELKTPHYLIPSRSTRFANGEVKLEILRSIRGMDIFVIVDCENHYPLTIEDGAGGKAVFSVNDHVMMLFAAVDAVLGAGARSCTLVLPAYPYARQHKKKGREPLTASWFGKVCEFMGVKRIITLDIHSKAIENSFHRLSLENLHASYQILLELSKLVDINNEDLVLVSPDTGAVDRNKFFAENLNKPLALLYKERDYSKVSASAEDNNIIGAKLLGKVKDKTVFMADDMLGTGGTLINAMRTLLDLGAKRIICAISLPLFSAGSMEAFDKAYQEGLFYRIIGTDAVYHDSRLYDREWFVCAGISGLFGEAIFRLQDGKSLSTLLDNRRKIQDLLSKGQES
ncbi:MAG: ribose-phosphate diphosphokinase [Spirochaetales bacterium]|jgi:ribose-phosphate pyrophosphokinase|nr:ribose-phosphate diphosphokinase [Spirochaetales bacterium]